MFRRLIRVYTPFMMAIVLVIYGVLYMIGYEGKMYDYFAEFYGHSFFAIADKLASSQAMCKWYKATLWILFAQHIPNTVNIINDNLITAMDLANYALLFGTAAFLCFIVYLTTRNIIKTIC